MFLFFLFKSLTIPINSVNFIRNPLPAFEYNEDNAMVVFIKLTMGENDDSNVKLLEDMFKDLLNKINDGMFFR